MEIYYLLYYTQQNQLMSLPRANIPRVYKDQRVAITLGFPKVTPTRIMSNTAIQEKENLKIETFKVSTKTDIQKLVSLEEVMEVARNVLNSEIESVKYSIQPYSDGKLGYLGSHYRLTVIATLGRKKTATLSFFLKTIPNEVPEQAAYVVNNGFFKQERLFYSILIPVFRKEYRGELWVPMCYKVKEDLLILEELSDKGYSVRDKLFNKTLVKAGISTIARLHATSLIAEKCLGSPLNQLYPEIFSQVTLDHYASIKKWLESGINLAVAIAERLGHNSDLIRVAFKQIDDIFKPSRTQTNVVSHNDLWGNNFMFNNDVPPKCVLVDYQLIKYTSLAHDVAQFLYLCTDRNFRETWESAMLRHYYETLCETLDAHGVGLTHRPTWSEVTKGMEEQRLYALMITIMYFPTVLMDKESSAQIFNDSVSYAQYTFRDKTEFVFSVMKKDSIYRRRINETIDELVEMASRLDQLPKPS